MPRPRRHRRIDFLPEVRYFRPRERTLGRPEEVRIYLEELEALRLRDLEGLEQEDCAARMEISRPTFHRVLAEARRKVAEALVAGKAIRLEGGDYKIAARKFRCLDCNGEWEMASGTGQTDSGVACPSCQGGNILRTDAQGRGFDRGARHHRGRRVGRGGLLLRERGRRSTAPGTTMSAREVDFWGDPVGENEGRLSICDLVANNTLDSRTGAYLWAVMEGAPSLLVLSGPRRAGKSTTQDALLDLTPEESRLIHIQGDSEVRGFPERPTHDPTYLVASEISPGPRYVWGSGVKRLFTYAQSGYRLSATMHADSLEGAVEQLRMEPNDVPLEQVAAFGLAVIIAVGREGREVRRRIAQVWRIDGLEENGERLKAELACTWNAAQDAFSLRDGLGVSESDIAARAAFLDDLVQRGVTEPEEVRRAIRSYRSGAGGSA